MSSTLPRHVPWCHQFCNMAISGFNVSCFQVHEELAPLAVSTEVINCTVCTGMESRLLHMRNSIHLVITLPWAHIVPSKSQPAPPLPCSVLDEMEKWSNERNKRTLVFKAKLCFLFLLLWIFEPESPWSSIDSVGRKELTWDLASFPISHFRRP